MEDDVKERAEERDIKLDITQIKEIIEEIDRGQDASLGINWDTLDCYIDEYKGE